MLSANSPDASRHGTVVHAPAADDQRVFRSRKPLRPGRHPSRITSSFWRRRTPFQSAHHQDAAFRACQARPTLGLEFPICSSINDFFLKMLTLREKTHCTCFLHESNRMFKKHPQGCQRPARHGVGAPCEYPSEILNPLRVHSCRRAGHADRLVEKRGLLGIALHQVDAGAFRVGQCAGQHQAREASTRPQIDPGSCGRHDVEQLERVGDVSRPKLRHACTRDQLRRALPVKEERDKAIEPGRCFT